MMEERQLRGERGEEERELRDQVSCGHWFPRKEKNTGTSNQAKLYFFKSFTHINKMCPCVCLQK